MSSYKDSPKPLRKGDPNPLFKMEEGDYVVKALSPIERQRREDGTPYTTVIPSAVEPRERGLYLKEEKVTKSVEAAVHRDPDPDEVVKAFMES